MSFFIVDVEADGRAPGPYSMVNFGVVKVDEALKTTFYGEVRPISDKFKPDALAVSGFSREQHLQFEDPAIVMPRFAQWVVANSVGRPVFVSDNPAFDWSFMNYYLTVYNNDDNPFGWSARRIGDIYSGLKRNLAASSDWKRLRVTKHTHNPVDDARGNAEALLALAKQYNLRIPK